jgi:hypothetical protein
VARTTGTTGKAGGKVVVASGKIGAAAMLGGATRSPYLSHRIGRSIGGSAPTSRAKNALIGSNVENPTQSLDDHADGSTGTSSAVAIESERATDHALSKDHRVESDAQSQDIDESGAF